MGVKEREVSKGSARTKKTRSGEGGGGAEAGSAKAARDGLEALCLFDVGEDRYFEVPVLGAEFVDKLLLFFCVL